MREGATIRSLGYGGLRFYMGYYILRSCATIIDLSSPPPAPKQHSVHLSQELIMNRCIPNSTGMRPASANVKEPSNYTKLSRKIIQRKDNSTNLSPYNPVVREISTDFKPFLITAKIVLSLTVTIISYIKVRGIKYIGV
jgi:hypothetical protein